MGYDVRQGSPAPQETPRLIRRWRLRRTILIVTATLVVTLTVVGLTSNWLAETLAQPLTSRDAAVPSDVVIVLGAGARKHGEPLPPQAKERIQIGVNLVQAGIAPRLIVAGGLSKQSGYVEAQLMESDAVARGLDDAQVYQEDQSRNTYENAVNTLSLMAENGWLTATVVTSSYHTYRACAIYHKLQADVRCVAASLNVIPTTTLYERLTDLRSVIREYGAIIYYRLKGHI